MSLILAIDQSTSATKALLVDSSARALDCESLPHAQRYPRPGWVEHDAAEIYSNLTRVVRLLLERNPARRAEVCAVSLTNQRETFVVFDRATGEPLAPAVVWQCRRGDALCEELRGAGADSEIERRTGLRLDSYFSAPKVSALLRHDPALRKRLADRTALVGTIDTYLVYRLTGGRVFATDATNASRTLLFNLSRLEWDPELCGLFGVDPRWLADVRDCDAHYGATDFAGLLAEPKPIVGVMGDSQASLFAQRCYRLGESKGTFGTGTSLLVNQGQQVPTPANGAVAALAWRLGGEATYALEGLVNYSAATLVWLKDQLGLIGSTDEAEPLAASVEDTAGVYIVPAFAGLGAPHWRPEARAAIVGLSAYSTRAHVVRAALESIAYQVADLLDLLAPPTGQPPPLMADGGASRNGLLMQMVADLTQRRVEVTDEPNLSAVGAAMAGLLGMGIAPSIEALHSLPRPSKVFLPAIGPREASTRREGWRRSVTRVL